MNVGELKAALGIAGSRARLAQNVKLLRQYKKWSQRELAQASGLHRTYISMVERSCCNVTLDSLDKLAMAFGVDPWDLLASTAMRYDEP